MTTFTNPLDIARETLKRLAAQRTPPTPDNYRALYHQIAETPIHKDEHPAERIIAQLLATLPKGSDEARRVAQRGEQALQEADWGTLSALLTKALGADRVSPDWNELIGTLVQQLERRHAGLTPTKKREALEHILASTRSADLLATRLGNLVTQWARNTPGDTPATAPAAAPSESAAQPDDSTNAWRDLCAFILETPCAGSLRDFPALAQEARKLAERLRAAQNPGTASEVTALIRKFAFRVELAGDDRGETHTGVVRLLQLMVDNIGELVIDDHWFSGQTGMLKDILSRPLDVRTIDTAETRLRELIFKQGQMKAGLVEAQQSLKTMLSDFVGQLASFARDTGAYHAKIDSYSARISGAASIVELQDVIQEVMTETRNIQVAAQRTQDDLISARTRVDEAKQRVAALETELARTSDMVRHDFLTGTLNRRGLEEAIAREISRAARREAPLCVAVLDVDNFKQLNDALGHQAGDQALVHLCQVVRESVRPQDTVARYGGEEFVILMPDTGLPEAQQALVRVQRELTRRFFLHGNQRILITFSAGVTQIPPGEPSEAAIARADALMYKAKQSGKNKVVSGEESNQK